MMEDYSNASLEGDMSIPGGGKSNSRIGAPDFNTLDEPIKETVVSSPLLTSLPNALLNFFSSCEIFVQWA